MTAAAFEARLCPTWLNEIKKTKLYNYTSPAAGINFLCAPSMSAVSKIPKIPESESLSQASWMSIA